MSSYKRIQETFQKEYAVRAPIYRARLTKWRSESSLVRVDHPTNLARARGLGYRAKKGFVIVRVSVRRGRRKREKPAKGRKPSKSGRFFSRHKSLQLIAEERAGHRYKNLEVLNSYWVGEDSQLKWFEIILAEPQLVGLQKGRVFRGLTRLGRRSRGLYPRQKD
jgi:large subunit ribosomal protein L15e